MNSTRNLRRRDLLAGLLALPAFAQHRPIEGGTALLLRLSDRKLLHVAGPDAAREWLVPPASTMKPLSLLPLLDSGKLHAEEGFLCTGHLNIQGHSLACVHPLVPLPMNASRAISYSCNSAVAHFAQRFAPGELSTALARAGLSSATGLLPGAEAIGRIKINSAGSAAQLQALGEEGVIVTPLELLLAYARLAKRVADAKFAPILEGLEGAVDFGTAQKAAVSGLKVAGKTGSILLDSGSPAAWFAGFAPSRAPEVAVVVLVPGSSGGADAAPLAAKILASHFAR